MNSHGHCGNPEWVGSVLEEYEAPLTRFAHGILGELDRARDVVQETFLRLCRESPENLDGHLRQWLYTVCRNKAIDILRKERRMTQLSAKHLILSQAREFEPAFAAESQDETGLVLQLITQLPLEQQNVIRLKFERGLSYREISEASGLTISHVGFLIHRGLKTIRGQMNESHRPAARRFAPNKTFRRGEY